MGTYCLFWCDCIGSVILWALVGSFRKKNSVAEWLDPLWPWRVFGSLCSKYRNPDCRKGDSGIGWRFHHLHHPRHHQRFLRKAGSGRSFCFNQWNHGRGPDFQFHFRGFVGSDDRLAGNHVFNRNCGRHCRDPELFLFA